MPVRPVTAEFEGTARPITPETQLALTEAWDAARRLWFASATTGKTLQAAKDAAASKTNVHRIHLEGQDTAEVILTAEEADPEGLGDDSRILSPA